MRYGPLIPLVGARPLQDYFLPANDAGGGDTNIGPAGVYGGPGSLPSWQRSGIVVPGFDNYFGGVEFMYGMAQGAINAWAFCTCAPALVNGKWEFVYAPVANTANQARPGAIAIQQMAAGQWGWFAVSGLLPVLCGASVAAGSALGITGAGQLGASSAGKEIENLVVAQIATTTLTKNVALTANNPIIQVTGNNTIDGLFVGAAVSGVGIPANAVVASLDPDGRRFSMSTGPGLGGAALSPTASGGIVLTVTPNDGTNFYNFVQLDRPFCQGRIT